MGKEAPKAPDYQSAAIRTANANMSNNRPNTNTPYSAQVRNPDGSVSVGFSGQMADVNSGLMGQAQGAMGAPLDLSRLPDAPDGMAAREQAIDAAYGAATARLDPQWAQREEAQQTRLLNQGLAPGSEAERNASRQLGEQRNDAYGQAMNSAIMQGNAAGQSVFNQGMASRQNALAEMLRQRGQPLAELLAMRGFLQQPQFNQVAGPDYLGAAGMQGNYDLGAWQAQNQANADLYGGIMDGASAAASSAAMFMSDERVKRDVVREETEALPGVPFASWEYLHMPGKRFRGVIAQDLQTVAPEYVHERPDGLLMVDYSFLSNEVSHG